MHRKGFPESYDRRALLRFVIDVKSGKEEVTAPVYCHLVYDIVPDEQVVVRRPDILIVEGLNVLQPARAAADGTTGLAVSDFFDFSVYVDADPDDIRAWYVAALPVAARDRVPRPALVLPPLRRADRRAGGAPGRGRLGHDQRPQPGAEHPADPRPGDGDPAQGRRPPRSVGAGSARSERRPASDRPTAVEVMTRDAGRTAPEPRTPTVGTGRATARPSARSAGRLGPSRRLILARECSRTSERCVRDGLSGRLPSTGLSAGRTGLSVERAAGSGSGYGRDALRGRARTSPRRPGGGPRRRPSPRSSASTITRTSGSVPGRSQQHPAESPSSAAAVGHRGGQLGVGAGAGLVDAGHVDQHLRQPGHHRGQFGQDWPGRRPSGPSGAGAVSTPSPVVACSTMITCPDCSPPRVKPPAFIASST